MKYIIIIALAFSFAPIKIQAQEIPVVSFPSCTTLTPPGDKASYESGLHQIAGGGLEEGRDDVYSLEDGNAVQCFCPTQGKGTQTNWVKTDTEIEGINIGNGKDWNLDDANYFAYNSSYICNKEVTKSTGTRKPKVKEPEPNQPIVVQPTPDIPDVVESYPQPTEKIRSLPRTGIDGLIILASLLIGIGIYFLLKD